MRALEALQPMQWWEGHLVCDVHDWRPLEAAARASSSDAAAPPAPNALPAPRRVLLRQGGDAVMRDARELASRYVPYRRRQLADLRARGHHPALPPGFEEHLLFAEAQRAIPMFESRILLAQYPALDLSPEPAAGGSDSMPGRSIAAAL